MPQPTLDIHEQFTMGSVLDLPLDRLPDGAFRLLRNARLDRTRQTVSSRHGSIILSTALAGAFPDILTLAKLATRVGDVYYAHVSNGSASHWYRLNSVFQAPALLQSFATAIPVSEATFMDGGGLTDAGAETPGIWKFWVGPGSGKDNGTVRRDLGLAAPPAAPASATLGSRKRLLMHSFDSAVSIGDTGTVAGTVVDTTLKQEGTGGTLFSIPPDGLGAIFSGMGDPVNTGPWIGGTDNSGVSNKLSMTDTTKNFFTLGLTRGSRFRNRTDGSEGIITRFSADTLFFDGGLSGGVENDVDHGDNYEIFFNLNNFDIYPTSGTDNGGTNDRLDRVIDTTKDFEALHIRPGMRVWNLVNGCNGRITSVATTTNPNDTLICSAGFTGSSENDFDAGDGYVVVDELVKDDDYIHLWMYADWPENIEWFQLDFDRDTATVANAWKVNYYTVRLPGSTLNQGRDTWTEVFIPKSQFTKIGTSGDWTAIRAWRITVRMSRQAGGSVVVDDFSLVGGYGIEGDIEYTAIYRSAATGGKSNPPLTQDREVLHTLTVEAKRHPITVSLTNLANPSNPEIDLIEIYRRGGALTDWTLVARLPDNTTSWSDTVHDAVVALGADPATGALETLETDNDLIPAGAVFLMGGGAYNRLFALIDRNKWAYSKAWEPNESRAEQWPKDFFFLTGDGSEVGMAGLVIDTSGYVYTDTTSYLFTGRGEDTFLPQAIPQSKGLASRKGLCYGDGQVFFLARDGIYSQRGMTQMKLTPHLDPFFSGQTVDGIAPLSRDFMAFYTLAFYDPPRDAQVVLSYLDSVTFTWKQLVLKRNPQTGQYTDASFDDYPVQPHAPLVDPDGPHLFYGTTDGSIIHLDRADNDADQATPIALDLITPAYHQQAPAHPKEYQQVFAEADSGGQTVTVTALTDKGATSTALGTFASTSAQTPIRLTDNLPTGQVYNLALRVQASLTTRFTLYRYGWHSIVHPIPMTELDLGETVFGTRHVLRHLWADVATAGVVTLRHRIDGVAIPDLTLGPTSGRQRVDLLVTDSPTLLRRGKVFDLQLSGTATFQLYGLLGILEREPDEVTFYDTREVTFDSVQLLSRLEVDLEAPVSGLAAIYVDGALRDTRIFPATSGRQRVSIHTPAELKGYAFRVVLTAATPFQPYGLWGRLREWRSVRFHQARPFSTIETLTVERNFLEGRVA